MRFMARIAVLGAVAVGSASSSGCPAERAPGPKPPAAPVATPLLTPQPSAASVEPPPPPPAERVSYVPAVSGAIPCGDTTCAAGREVCCGGCRAVSSGLVAPGGGEDGVPGVVTATARACLQTAPAGSLEFCASSAQCPTGSVCGMRPIVSDMVSAFYCHEESDATAWNYEPCGSEDSECRTPHTICVFGECRNERRAIAGCGAAMCGPRELCWRTPGEERAGWSCTRKGEGFVFVDDCDGPEDCLPGQYCCAGFSNRCDRTCSGGDTPSPVCADHQPCEWGTDCDSCGARAH